MDPDALYADVIEKYSRHINPYLAKLMAFAGFGVEVRGEERLAWGTGIRKWSKR